MSVEPLAEWGRRLQAIAQTGLAYGEPTEHDRDRYEQVRRIAAEMLAGPDGAVDLDARFSEEEGHATPKVDVRGVVFRGDDILLVQERDDGLWTLPGGWVDVGESPAEAVVREVREESGYETRAVKLLALLEHDRHLRTSVWHQWMAFFLCEPVEAERGELDPTEIVAVGFFGPGELPTLSPGKSSAALLVRLRELRGNPDWPTVFD